MLKGDLKFLMLNELKENMSISKDSCVLRYESRARRMKYACEFAHKKLTQHIGIATQLKTVSS